MQETGVRRQETGGAFGAHVPLLPCSGIGIVVESRIAEGAVIFSCLLSAVS
jgi:hypothetical protein